MAKVATITIDHTKVAADLTDFPVLIVCNGDAGWAELYALATASGGDIRTFKSGGTAELPREIVSFTIVGENGEIHVKNSGTLSSTVDTDIEIHADGVSADYAVGATYGRNAVWSAFSAKWHFAESSGNAGDSTGNGNTLVNNGSVTYGAEKIGNGVRGTDTTGGYLKVDSAVGFTATATRSTSFWYKKQSGGADGYILDNITAAGEADRVIIYENSLKLNLFVNGNEVVSSTLTAGVYYLVTYTQNSNSYILYIDGVSQGTRTRGGANYTGGVGFAFLNGLYTGGTRTTSDGDELSVATFTQSANWITTEYNNQNSPSTFYTVVAETTGTNFNASTLPTTLAIPAPTIAGASNVAPGTLALNLSLLESTTIGASNHNASVLPATLAIVPPEVFVEPVTNIDASVLTLTTAILEPLTTGASNVDVDSLGVALGTLEPTVIGGSNTFPEILGLEMSVLYPSTIGGLWARIGRNPGEWTRLPVNND